VGEALLLAVVPQQAGALRERGVVGRDRAAVTECAEVLRRIEAERTGRSERAGRRSVVEGAVGLRAVLDDRKAAAFRQRDDRLQLGALPVQVNGHDRARPRCQRLLEPARVERAGCELDVGEHRSRPARLDAGDRGHAGVRSRHDLVARADLERLEGDRDRVGPGGDAHGEARSAVGGEGLLEALDLLAEDEPAASEYALQRRVELVAELRGLAGEVEEGDAQRASSQYAAPCSR